MVSLSSPTKSWKCANDEKYSWEPVTSSSFEKIPVTLETLNPRHCFGLLSSEDHDYFLGVDGVEGIVRDIRSPAGASKC